MRRIVLIWLALSLCVSPVAYAGETASFISVPDVVRPGKVYELEVSAGAALTLALYYANGQAVSRIFEAYPAEGHALL